jgi:hypothetical protein
MVKQVPHVAQYIKASLKIGMTQFHFINLQIWIFG